MTEYNELTPELISQLQAIVGEEDCHVGENISEDYSHDEMPIYGTKMPGGLLPQQHRRGCCHHEAVQREQDSRYGSRWALAWLAVAPRCRAASYCAPCT